MNRVVILMYHIVASPLSASEARYCCTPDRFEAQMRALAASGMTLLTLDQVVDAVEGRDDWPRLGVAVTFDDGFSHTVDNAFPVLERLRIPATMFALSDRLGATNDWMSERGFPRRSLATAAQLREAASRGVSIGSHTRTHPRLPELGAQEKRDQILASKARLEDLIGCSVRHFAYPFGLVDEDARQAVAEAGYRGACSVRSGFNTPGVDRYLLRRVEVFGRDTRWRFRQKLKFGVTEISPLYPLRYYAGRVSSRLGF